MLQLTFNPGLTLTGFQTTRPWYSAKKCDSFLSGTPPPKKNPVSAPALALTLAMCSAMLSVVCITRYAS